MTNRLLYNKNEWTTEKYSMNDSPQHDAELKKLYTKEYILVIPFIETSRRGKTSQWYKNMLGINCGGA